jgi:hypothetical protein
MSISYIFIITDSGSVHCDFDTDLCSWAQSMTDQFNWTRSSGGTPSSGTGPIGDHSGTGIYFFFIAQENIVGII